ncbi:MAG: hypothetical protein IT514_12585 [Burkholderiales bacterium]|nr:hypothetical protein [Burkholderiales bacterium]
MGRQTNRNLRTRRRKQQIKKKLRLLAKHKDKGRSGAATQVSDPGGAGSSPDSPQAP